ncbi:uncharacterized protein PITG_13142 [Phytophthora infestans T30-4]|uniref:Uncharacterized protein n=1 Tax=Phytophthora infestans (strain T30-4) TaxID=403677 RepID=D0NJP2_PHYIT|nr:uncharacterized protein PITG_13142 [Phytophthora infestans T30-4]EEY59978.1 hypothetical protein PITG_13142 [Phytophthora infestans T30-4]|eukprot:XP_002900663.1 hypothetical protein PITG_13142 [Phytophthora infestans T30-4]
MSPHVNTPVVAEVVDTSAPSVIEPVEASNVKAAALKVFNDWETSRQEFQTGAIYENLLPYYYVRKYDDPAVFLNVVFADKPLFHMCKLQDHQQLLYFIKNIINPDFEFIKLDYIYIGFRNESIQVRTYIDSEFELNTDYAQLLDQYLQFQFDDETIEFIYFMIGRLMTAEWQI